MLIAVAKANVKPGKLEDLKALMAYLEERMTKNEPNYYHRIYLSEDQTEITFFEHFGDEDALLNHWQEHQADPEARQKIDETLEFTSVEVFAGPFEKTAEVLRQMKAKFYPHTLSVIERTIVS
ncbi:MAG TPA: antibiotic biosynthesis monooxygenase [Aggregatilineaceae bacterium]|nr:antibiotic biosynthesis monooxygenase [Aggregatilineaceae bacterium]